MNTPTPYLDNHLYTFGCAAGQIVYTELKETPYKLNLFARHFHRYCKRMNDIEDIKDFGSRTHLHQLSFEYAKDRMKKLFNDEILPKKLLSFALNAVCYINTIHVTKNRKSNKRLRKLIQEKSVLEK